MSMTDGEVEQWLSEGEQNDFQDALDDSPGGFYSPSLVQAFHTLAKTRKALWDNRLYDSWWCHYCNAGCDMDGDDKYIIDADGNVIITEHHRDCILATMPRPS